MRSYHVYLPVRSALRTWGCAAVSVGCTAVAPRAPYPPQRHPAGHHFRWADGRTLESHTILLVTSGRGVFECADPPGTWEVKAGTVILLFPGIWHRYKPAADTGWEEHWIECVGPGFDGSLRARLVDPLRPVVTGAAVHELADCFARCHALARENAQQRHDQISTLGLHMLALVSYLQRMDQKRGEEATSDLVQAARWSISARCQEALDPAALAARLGVSYSHLRHAFRREMGVGLKQYQLEHRLQHARKLLADTRQPVKEIAEVLGFDSASHLSKLFRRRFDASPRLWRKNEASPRSPRSTGKALLPVTP